MDQHYENYTPHDFEVWKILYDRQYHNLKTKGSKQINQCFDRLKVEMNNDKIPNFVALSTSLYDANKWCIEVVPGLIPVEDFFGYLAQKKFCASTWLRKKSQLDYIEEPDMFHDIFGHIPLLLDSQYAACLEKIGKLGVKYTGNENVILQLQNLYWFTVEFGLINENNSPKVYGAGIVSSYGETNHIFEPSTIIQPFDLEAILKEEFVKSEIQKVYYQLESYEQLYDSVNRIEEYITV